MTLCILAATAVVTVAAAARSTWSPCGLSMLSTITPFSERAKGNSYCSTVAWFVVGAASGGATLGVTMGLLAAAVAALHLSVTTLAVLAFVAALVCGVSDAGVAGVRLPYHRRQVNERWLDQYRPWVYGAGFGWQIGTGLATYITTAAVYLMVVLGALTANPALAFGLGLAFGALRGTAVLLTRRLTDPDRLRSFHRRFTAAGPAVGKAVMGTELAVAGALALALRSPIALAAAGAGALAAVVATTRARRLLAR